jgi:hypothetical protein
MTPLLQNLPMLSSKVGIIQKQLMMALISYIENWDSLKFHNIHTKLSASSKGLVEGGRKKP